MKGETLILNWNETKNSNFDLSSKDLIKKRTQISPESYHNINENNRKAEKQRQPDDCQW